MQINRQLFLLMLFIGLLQYLSAEEYQPVTRQEEEKKITFYAGINPWALASFLPNPINNYVNVMGIASGQEFGISLYGGMHFLEAHSLEVRFSTGPADSVFWDTQLQFGYIWYPFEQFLNWKGGLMSGLMLRQFFWKNSITDYVIFNLTQEILLGWRFHLKSIAFDVRAGWNISSVTWSTMPNTGIGSGQTQFPYNLNLITGIVWVFN